MRGDYTTSPASEYFSLPRRRDLDLAKEEAANSEYELKLQLSMSFTRSGTKP
jgi:hypothetical protein